MNLVIHAADLLVDDQIGDQDGPVVIRVDSPGDGAYVEFTLADGARYALGASAIMEVWRNPRYAETYDTDSVSLVDDAIIHAAVTGSTGGGMRIHDNNTLTQHTTVDRVAQHAAAWRVTDHHDAELIGKVFVVAGMPGRYPSHAVDV